MPRSLEEQLLSLQHTREVKLADIKAIMTMASEAGRTTTVEEGQRIEDLEEEVRAIEGDIARVQRLMRSASTAKPVVRDGFNPSYDGADAVNDRAPMIMTGKKYAADESFLGHSYVRSVIAQALAFSNIQKGAGEFSALAIAKQRWRNSKQVLDLIQKASVAGGGSGSGEWGAELVSPDNRFVGDFIEFLNAQTVFFRLPLRQVPANVKIKGQDGAATGYWVGESKAIPATAGSMSDVDLKPLKTAALAVVSNELLRDSSPSAEQLVRDMLGEASGQRVDLTFLSATAASAGVSPAGILNGLSAITSAGTDIAGVKQDLKALLAPFQTAKIPLSGITLVTTPTLATALALMDTALGVKAFATMTPNGGALEGFPAFVGDNVGAGNLIALKPSEIWRIGDSGVEVSMSRDATIEMSDAPTGASDTPTAASVNMVNMFQSESTAIKVVRPINFQKRRAAAVAYVSDAAYGTVESP
jgi:HK97 family phage major capsid protein